MVRGEIGRDEVVATGMGNKKTKPPEGRLVLKGIATIPWNGVTFRVRTDLWQRLPKATRRAPVPATEAHVESSNGNG